MIFNCLKHGISYGGVCMLCLNEALAMVQQPLYPPTRRQYYAAKAMQGIITANAGLNYDEISVARNSFAMADAMIKFEQNEQS
jgi:hypothetical protein